MNVFYLDTDLLVSVAGYFDAHVPKIALECLQVLSDVWYQHHPKIPHYIRMASTDHRLDCGFAPYMPTHQGHPLVRFASSSRYAYLFILEYAEAILAEYTLRYGRVSKMERVASFLRINMPPIPDVQIREYPVCRVGKPTLWVSSMKLAVALYRDYYKTKRVNRKYATVAPPGWWERRTK